MNPAPLLFNSLTLILGFLLFGLLAPTPLAAQTRYMEESVLVRHMEPSEMLERIQLLAGIPDAKTRKLELTADDAANTLVIRIPESYGTELECHRLRLILRDYISRMDKPEPKVALSLYLVQNNLLTEDEFRSLDRRLTKAPVDIPGGTTLKGVVQFLQGEYKNLEILEVDQLLAERRAQTRPEEVTLKGRILPYANPDGRVHLNVELLAEAIDKPLADGVTKVNLTERTIPPPNKPLIIVGGKRLSKGSGSDFPGRHEVMLYVWAKPIEQKTKK